MGEIKSEVNIAAEHSRAISNAAGKCTSSFKAIGGGAQNQPEESMISAYNTLMGLVNSLGSSISSDGGNIEAIGNAFSNRDNQLSHSFNLSGNE